jgi:hypothetical protein
MRLPGGPLAYRSAEAPRPLGPAEEAALAFVEYKYAQGTEYRHRDLVIDHMTHIIQAALHE